MSLQKILGIGLLLLGCITPVQNTQAEDKPIRALLITGGCCHDYTQQKKLLTEGISARANVVWSVVHEGDGTTDHRISVYSEPDWAKNYDVIVHDECFSDVKDAEFVRGILKPHRAGLPAVNLHCAMHSYRVSFDTFKEWFEFTGIDSRAHGPQLPIELTFTNNTHPILSGLTNWTTVNEELYDALEIWKNVTPLIYGAQPGAKHLAAWVNDYRGTRVFSTTLGHNSATVGDPRYLDLVTRGLLWSVDKLNKDYLKPATKRKAQKMIKVPVNLALKKKAIASATENGRPAELATDGDLDTRWCAPDNGNDYWWQVDLEKPEEITGVRIIWEKESAAYQYRITGSADGGTWQTLVEEKTGPRPQMDEKRFSASGIRHVRITITQAPSGSWASFFEFEVLGKEMVEKPASLFDPRLGGVQSPAGFDQTLFAAPPNITYPTCLEATPWGDVFVGVDLNGSLDREKGRGWVVRCRDTNGDGEADDFSTFAKMDSPRGLVFDNNTLYVMHPPLLQAFHDDNADGVADRSEVLVSGLGKDLDFRGADHTCNGIRLGIDGFLYIALGDYGAEKAIGKDGRSVQLYGGGIIRVRTDGTGLEVVAVGTRNTYDVAIDPFMNLFTCDNTNDGDGWNLRLSHMIHTAHYGYPSLYKNFAKEMMPAMNDFGGGSPTGALFLDEPGFPDEFGTGLYTCQWGWNNVSRHALKPSGATFSAEKETFVRIPRPTGIAADGQGNLYIASWKGATFNYTGSDAGFVVRVSDLNNQPTAFPDLRKSSEKELLELLAVRSAVKRLHVQREILRRPPNFSTMRALQKLAETSTNHAVQAAVLFTLGQMDTPAATKILIALASKAGPLREFALRAGADSTSAAQVKTEVFTTALEDQNPAVRLQAIVALNRLQRTEAAGKVFPFLVDSDPAISHAAFRAMVSFRAVDICLNALSDERMAPAALRVLGNIHDTRVVNALIAHLSHEVVGRRDLLETLCRLYHREGDWDGAWWGTRPDSTGPYYKPVAWDGTDAIVRVLRQELSRNDSATDQFLLVALHKYKITDPPLSVETLQRLVQDKQLEASLRKNAFHNLARISDEAAARGLVTADASEVFIKQLRNDFTRDPQRGRSAAEFARMAGSTSASEKELAFAVLLHVAAEPNLAAAARQVAQQAIDAARDDVTLRKVKETLGFSAPTVAESASAANTIGKLPYEEVLKKASSAAGDVNAGAKLFETTGCVKCHTVTKDQPPTGPFLGDITARYSAAELLESILRPSAKIAQGFETTSIENKEGDVFDGFIVRESGDEVELRNLAGSTIIAKKDIARRGTRTTSIMPEGLVDNVAPEELASLLSYLRAVAAK